MSDNDDAGAQAVYDEFVTRGVDLGQFGAARLRIGMVNAESDEMDAQWTYVKQFYFGDARERGYLPPGGTLNTCTLDELRTAEAEFYGDEFPPD